MCCFKFALYKQATREKKASPIYAKKKQRKQLTGKSFESTGRPPLCVYGCGFWSIILELACHSRTINLSVKACSKSVSCSEQPLTRQVNNSIKDVRSNTEGANPTYPASGDSPRPPPVLVESYSHSGQEIVFPVS
ncbi:hypothetical protein HJG60_010088 [Phyllostomus discolor]|uniref:Uncharacterized protein n=1 Tax=Phyllostomus discolor TaxID=89673 RepID=A0A834EG33_9CHIR|nr:hypothetical protein HJG60_010088 [Phyllostomus discolor]